MLNCRKSLSWTIDASFDEWRSLRQQIDQLLQFPDSTDFASQHLDVRISSTGLAIPSALEALAANSRFWRDGSLT